MNTRLKTLTLYSPNVNNLCSMFCASQELAKNRDKTQEPISPPQIYLSILPEKFSGTHSALRNFITEFLPPSPYRRPRRDQQEVNVQQQERNRSYFYFFKRSHIRFGENGRIYCLASRVSNFPHPHRRCQTKNIYVYISLTPRRQGNGAFQGRSLCFLN